jgi:hypothetical protein
MMNPRAVGRENPDTLFSIVERLIAKYREWKTRRGPRDRELNEAALDGPL